MHAGNVTQITALTSYPTTNGRLQTESGCVIFITTITQQSEHLDIITGIF